jgi:hypothetical protein
MPCDGVQTRKWKEEAVEEGIFFGRPRNGRGEEIAGGRPTPNKVGKIPALGGKFTGEE